MRFTKRGAVTGLCLAVITCVPARAQQAETIRLTAKPAAVFADGAAFTTITAEVRNRGGALVADGQTVRFSTTLGTIEAASATQAGQASVRLTSSTIAGRAIITASSGQAAAETSVDFTSRRVVVENASSAVSIRAKYLLYNDFEQVVDAAEDVRIRIGDIEVTADRAQLNLQRSVLVAESRSGASGLVVKMRDKKYAADRFQYSWDARSGMMAGLVEPVRGLFVFNGVTAEITQAVGPPPAHEFEFADLTPSPYAVKAARVVFLPGTELQFTRARILLNGKQRLSLPYHIVPLGPQRTEYAQYIGLGSRGPLLDIPYYIAAGPVGTSQFRLKYNAPEGLYGATVPGWALDLLTAYALGSTTSGSLALTRVTSPDWGVSLTHNQDLGARTRGFFNLDTRSGFGLFKRYTLANVSLSHQAREYSATFSAFASRTFLTTGDVNLSAQTTPKPLGAGFAWSVGGTVGRRWAASSFTDVENATVVSASSQSLSGRVIAPTLRLSGGTVVNASVGQGLSFGGGSSRRSVRGTVTAMRPLGKTGSANLVYNYSDYGFRGTDTSSIKPERQTVTASVSYTRVPRWSASAFATAGLDQRSQNVRVSGRYQFSDVWSAYVNAGIFRQGLAVRDPILDIINRETFQAVNVEARITRIVGERSLSLVYSTFHHKVYLDYVPGKYF